MIRHTQISDKDLLREIKKGSICFGGNAILKIFGRLNCSSGKRMKEENRIFFSSLEEAIGQGFRPCGHCMKHEYKNWKHEII